MFDYIVSGISENNAFRVYTGTTPYNAVLYGYYQQSTTEVTISNVPYDYVFFVIIEDVVTLFRKAQRIHTQSAYCSTVCYGSFTLSPVLIPTPTPTNTPTTTPTPTITPTISVTPSPTASERIPFSPTPTQTPTISLSPTPTPTITLTPSNSVVYSCGFYSIEYNPPPERILPKSIAVSYVRCKDGSTADEPIPENFTFYACIQELGGVPLIYIPSGYEPWVSINFISICID